MPAPMPALTVQQGSSKPHWLSVQFRYNSGMVALVKQLPKRFYNPETKGWEFEPSRVAINHLQNLGTHITVVGDQAKQLWLGGGGNVAATESPAPAAGKTTAAKYIPTTRTGSSARKCELPADFKFVTLPFVKQREGMGYLAANPKFYLNMEVGTGKTKMFIDAMRLRSHLTPASPLTVLIVGPNNKVPDYNRELRTHAGAGNYAWFDGRGGAAKWAKACKAAHAAVIANRGKAPFLVVVGLNWESLDRRTKGLPVGYFDGLILDEAHNAKNPSSAQGKAAARMARGTPYVLAGSGSPCPQGPFDLWNQISMLIPGLLPSDFTSHRRRYAIEELCELPGNEETGRPARRFMQVVGYQNLNELADIFSHASFTAFKEDCFDLPAVVCERRYVEMDAEQRTAYNEIQKDGVMLLSPEKVCLADNAGVVLMRAMQVCGGFIGLTDLEGRSKGEAAVPVPGKNRKLEYVCDELIPELLASRTGRQCVVWAFGRAELFAIIERLRGNMFVDATGVERNYRVASLWGDTPKSERATLDADFRAGKYDILVSNPASGGTGMEFQTADVEIWYSRSFNLTHREQGEGRLHRYGQKHSVLRIDVLCEDTLEDYVLEVLESKQNLQHLLTSNPKAALRAALQK